MAQLKMKAPVDDIVDYFERLPLRVFKRSDLNKILKENRGFWRIRDSFSLNKFINYLLEETKLEMSKFEFPKQNYIRYTWGKAPFYEVVNSLLSNSYFTHYTAMFLNELTEQIPNTVYLNFEQVRKIINTGGLEQSNIDLAFKRSVRVSKTIGSYDGKKICFLNGKNTGRLGVIEVQGPEGDKIFSTNIERTLIDIAVRPVYSGGPFEVQKAYRMAKGKFSVNRLSAMLKKIDYTYPYHQVIGFYLENAGVYKETSINLFKKIGLDYDFYLTHQMKDAVYSKEWRLYYPKGL